MADIVKFGALYIDGAPAACGEEYTSGPLEIGDTIPGKELEFVKVGDLLVANQVVCTNISWEQLNKQGFIFGKEVWVDGKPYLCRSLKVGERDGVPNEWDQILDKTGEDDSLWHWKGKYFWGQEVSTYSASSRAVRGWNSARYWLHSHASGRGVTVGFRPVLECLATDTLDPDSMIGQKVLVMGPGGSFAGILLDCTDYDLFLAPVPGAQISPDWGWCCQTKKRDVVVARSIPIFKKNH